jgi:hypothetical protein
MHNRGQLRNGGPNQRRERYAGSAALHRRGSGVSLRLSKDSDAPLGRRWRAGRTCESPREVARRGGGGSGELPWQGFPKVSLAVLIPRPARDSFFGDGGE